ncbi:hypothetical protein BH24ACT3_BH24ACT3_16320 [soil metagenome]
MQRYFANAAEYAALAGSPSGGKADKMVVAPVFRGNWATYVHHPA